MQIFFVHVKELLVSTQAKREFHCSILELDDEAMKILKLVTKYKWKFIGLDSPNFFSPIVGY